VENWYCEFYEEVKIVNRTISVSLVISLIVAIGAAGLVSATPRLLKECNMVYWTSDDSTLNGVAGNQVSGFKLKLDGSTDTWYYLNIKFIKPDLPLGVYMFVLTPPPTTDTAFWQYWAAKGVLDSATYPSWQWFMWRIIHGGFIPGYGITQLPMFGLRSDGAENYELRDGLVHFASGFTQESPLRLNGDYPIGTYTFTCYGATELTQNTQGQYPPLAENVLDGVVMTITFR
jgi:hypothetical protein